jgi:hypothetical protein
VSDERWIEIDRDTASAVTHFSRAGQIADDPAFEAEDMLGYRAQMAFMHAMQSGHTSLENALIPGGGSIDSSTSWPAMAGHPRLCCQQHRSRGWPACAGHDVMRRR